MSAFALGTPPPMPTIRPNQMPSNAASICVATAAAGLVPMRPAVYVLIVIAEFVGSIFVFFVKHRPGRCPLDRQRAHPSYGVVFAAWLASLALHSGRLRQEGNGQRGQKDE
ncbi:uncharacterized protein M421DRAFT_10706 [Didymella exigua CBS 183.55]|uniref:Uncharacterized protein n=1 Tax=Didymella exigua CBS 183.55 TaxID=1150837 RepID=A0A6A5R505_9PLEO|nr:uncharacterized protein M421DRAFT_10706 [Didymella exigua CBS 183.55]KAF1922250.1 hypothetical protein M421DRAFT_10706 [Didymella exigua CBS 183.55]